MVVSSDCCDAAITVTGLPCDVSEPTFSVRTQRRLAVTAANDYDAPPKPVSPSQPAFHERVFPRTAIAITDRHARRSRQFATPGAIFAQAAGAIGIVYRSNTGFYSQYFDEAILPEQLHCCVWFEETKAVGRVSSGRPD